MILRLLASIINAGPCFKSRKKPFFTDIVHCVDMAHCLINGGVLNMVICLQMRDERQSHM